MELIFDSIGDFIEHSRRRSTTNRFRAMVDIEKSSDNQLLVSPSTCDSWFPIDRANISGLAYLGDAPCTTEKDGDHVHPVADIYLSADSPLDEKLKAIVALSQRLSAPSQAGSISAQKGVRLQDAWGGCGQTCTDINGTTITCQPQFRPYLNNSGYCSCVRDWACG